MKRLLFFTNSDYGQANVMLATAHALMHVAPDVEIHIASFHGLQAAVRATSDFALASAPPEVSAAAKPLVFHGLDGMSWGPASFRPETGIAATNDLTPGWVNSAKCVLAIPGTVNPWRPHEFMPIYHDVERILNEVQPDLSVIDPLFTPGMTLCHHLKANWVVLAPNTIKDFAIPLQPRLAMLWKYPIICSTMPFPLPWSLVARNIFLTLVAGYALLTEDGTRGSARLLREEFGTSISVMTANELGVLKSPPAGLRILVGISPDLDYPFSVMPPHITPCGPIVRAVAPIRGADAALADWLGRGPTVYVNLGTHLKATPGQALEMARAFRDLLDRAAALGGEKWKSLQILWKLGRKPEVGGEKPERDVYEGSWKAVVDVLRPELDLDKVRITDWVAAEPKSVLESGHVVCSVHHGGANSFYEALCAGVPQVALPPWSDCYDFANRIELLGVGRWANKKAKPRWERKELADFLVEVLFGPGADDILARVRVVASRHQEGAGREMAARELLAFAGA